MAHVLRLIHEPQEKSAWNTRDVIKYLTMHQRSLKRSDWELLKTSQFFEATDGKLYRASDLYAPYDDLELDRAAIFASYLLSW